MAAKQTEERVYVMKQNFMELHRQGYTILEIAEKFSLHHVTVYRHLQEIADENGTTREALLQVVKVSKSRRSFNEEVKREKATFESVINGFKNLENELDEIIAIIEEELKNDTLD